MHHYCSADNLFAKKSFKFEHSTIIMLMIQAFHLRFLSLLTFSTLILTSSSADCPANCGGCTSGRCDVFGCTDGLYCCLELSQYGACCTTCGPPIPQECLNPSGNDCSFYNNCLERYQQCTFVETIAEPKCQEYADLEKNLSSDGQKWSQYVRPCLQKMIAQNVLAKYGQRFTCDSVEKAFFDAHVPCYASELPGLPYGFCSLGIGDEASIIRHAKDIFVEAHFYEATTSAFAVVTRCVMNFTEVVVIPAVEKAAAFVIPIVAAAMSEQVLVFGWTAILLEALQTAIPKNSDEIRLLIVFKVANYTGPNTPWPKVNMTDTIAPSLLQTSINNVTNNSWIITEYNGKPYRK